MVAGTFYPNYPQKTFEKVSAAVDVVIFSIVNDELAVLLMKVKNGPLAGHWVLPGGLVRVEETLDEAALRHLGAKAGITNIFFEQLATFGDPKRDPLGRVISVSYYALIESKRISLSPSVVDERYSETRWFSVKTLPKIGYDHLEIITAAVNRLKSKIGYTNIVYSLLPLKFTLTDLQHVYEIILGRPLDKRNFRKKILSLGLIKNTGEENRLGRHRPAELYKFRKHYLQVVDIL